MSTPLTQPAQPFDFDRLQQIVVVNDAIGLLLGASAIDSLHTFHDPEED
jgi:hypothetical protein